MPILTLGRGKGMKRPLVDAEDSGAAGQLRSYIRARRNGGKTGLFWFVQL